MKTWNWFKDNFLWIFDPEVIWALLVLLAVASLPASWLTHAFWGIHILMNDAYTTGTLVLAVLGVVMFPVGILHGYYLWFMWLFF